MTDTANYLVAGLALAVLLAFMDRLRVMDWRTHRRTSVAAHLAFAWLLGQIVFDGLVNLGLDWPSVIGVAGATLWAWLTRRSWDRVHTLPAFMDTMPDRARYQAPAPARSRR